MAAYSVSRSTVQALRRLRADGTVLAGPGQRPRLNPEIRQPIGALYSRYESIEAAGLEQRSVVRHLKVCDDAEACRQLGVEVTTSLVHLERLRFAGNEPLAIDRMFLPASLAAPILEADLTSAGFSQVLEARPGIRLTGGHEVLKAMVPTRAQRDQLAMPSGVALLAIEPLGKVDDRIVEWRQTFVRGDRFSVIADFSRLPRQAPRPGPVHAAPGGAAGAQS